MKNVILASQSTRRKELLQQVIKEFEVKAADIDERAIQERVMTGGGGEPFLERAKTLVEHLAEEKAKKVLDANPEALVIGADTIVVQEGQILGKPEDEEEAYAMLRSYAGRSHAVLTGFSIQTREKVVSRSVETEVRFFEWNGQMDREMKQYVASGSPMDKAGAYGIQEEAALWVAEIHGDYPNVIGLPVAYVNRALQEFSDR